jgi:hypothetical protein
MELPALLSHVLSDIIGMEYSALYKYKIVLLELIGVDFAALLRLINVRLAQYGMEHYVKLI